MKPKKLNQVTDFDIKLLKNFITGTVVKEKTKV